ncbi:MAG: hypothetical protein H8D34_31625 [Chloroflexi bacterium]|nr:hypothetical protein [Chloroflexota bacterium]
MKQYLLVTTIFILTLSACYDVQAKSKTATSSAQVESVSNGDSVPIQIRVVGHYNIVKFKGAFYACPHGQEVNWEIDNVAKLPGVFVADSENHLIAKLPR